MEKTSDIAQRRALARDTGDPNYRLRRAELMQAAGRVFKRKGFRAARLSDIATEAGIDRASLYYYVAGKEEFFREVVQEATMDNVLMVEEICAGEGSSPQKIAALIERLMRSFEAHYPYLFVYVQENMTHIDEKTSWGREMRALGRRFDAAVTAIVQQGLDDGSLRSAAGGDARLIAFGIIGMCNWSHRWFTPTGKHDAKEVSDSFASMVLKGLAHEA